MIESTLTTENKIAEAKQFLKDNFEDGCICPCCHQPVKMYKRKLNSVMSRMLIQLYFLKDEWNHVSDIAKGISDTGTNDFSKLRNWLLIEQKKNEDSKKKTSGFWKITPLGRLFVEGKVTVPSFVNIYNTKKYGESTEMITIEDALGVKFNYQKLMNNEY